MTAMSMNFVVTHRVTPASTGWVRTMLRAGRRLTDTLRASLNAAPQDRADKYVARMPIAVLAA